MYYKMICNDIKKSKLTTATIAVFVFLAALLTATAAALIVNLFSSIDHMMAEAKAPHFMQMHSGELDRERLDAFADRDANIEACQVLEFLNIEGAEIAIGDETLADSIQDNGLSVQSTQFDYLLTLDGEIIEPSAGEIYVPVYYMTEGLAELGAQVKIHGTAFTIAGFIRDSQMNSALISSKRFLVSREDFEQLRQFGMLEYLIEFRFLDDSVTAAFENAYLEAGLESNGPPGITFPLIRVANAISDGMMIAVLILVSVLVIVVTFLCIRFTLLAKIETDYREIGVLKAVGIRVSGIKKLYLAKYGVIGAATSLLGFLGSLFLQQPLLANIRLYMGEGGNAVLGRELGLAGAFVIFLIIILYVNGILRCFRRISAAQAIRQGAPDEKSHSARKFRLSRNKLFPTDVFLGIKDVMARKKLYFTMLLVLIISTFILVVPQNIYNTISARSFMTYMGVGDCDLRLDLRQTDMDGIREKTELVAETMERDNNLADYTVLTSMMFDVKLDEQTTGRLKVELGDHQAFPIEYSIGGAPQDETEIALSALYADDLEKTVGDELILVVDGQEQQLVICGIYSDVTNGGRTAKALFQAKQHEILWSIIPVRLNDRAMLDESIRYYKENFPYARVSNIDDYIDQSFGSITAAIRSVSFASIAAAAVLTFLITLLFMKMLITKDRYSIAVLKASGFTNQAVRRQYLTRAAVVLIFGLIIGIVLSNTLGEAVGVAVISSFGASTFHFQIAPLFAYVLSPLLIGGCVCAAAILGCTDIKHLQISKFIKE